MAALEPIIVTNVPKERFKQTCSICTERQQNHLAGQGACMSCARAGCKSAFHVTCAHEKGFLFEEYVNSSSGSVSPANQLSNGENSPNSQTSVNYRGYCALHITKLVSLLHPCQRFWSISEAEAICEFSTEFILITHQTQTQTGAQIAFQLWLSLAWIGLSHSQNFFNMCHVFASFEISEFLSQEWVQLNSHFYRYTKLKANWTSKKDLRIFPKPFSDYVVFFFAIFPGRWPIVRVFSSIAFKKLITNFPTRKFC